MRDEMVTTALHTFTPIFDNTVQHFGWNYCHKALNFVFDLLDLTYPQLK